MRLVGASAPGCAAADGSVNELSRASAMRSTLVLPTSSAVPSPIQIRVLRSNPNPRAT